MNAINPNKAFRVIVRSQQEYRTVVSRAISWGFDWPVNVADEQTPFAVVFYPNADGKAIIRRQMTKRVNGTMVYCNIRQYRFAYFMKSNLRYSPRDKRHNYTAYPVRAIHHETEETHDFDSCLDAVTWLKSIGKTRATRQALYQCIQPFNNRLTAYGFRWYRVYENRKAIESKK